MKSRREREREREMMMYKILGQRRGRGYWAGDAGQLEF